MKISSVLGVALGLSLVLFASQPVHSQNEKPKSQKTGKTAAPVVDKTKQAEKKPAGRLPQHYGQLGLSDAQQDQVYAVQAKYHAEIDELQKKLDALREKRDAEIHGVLNSAQKTKLAELESAAKTKTAKTKATTKQQADTGK